MNNSTRLVQNHNVSLASSGDTQTEGPDAASRLSPHFFCPEVGMKEIKLTQGKVTLVDDEDYDYLSQWKWFAHTGKASGITYARRTVNIKGRNPKTVSMHNYLMGTAKGMHTDHINGDGLDNRRRNLRVVSPVDNWRNQKPTVGSSKFKGVYFRKDLGKWYARISPSPYKRISLGVFASELDAARAYDEASIEYHGPSGRTNKQIYGGEL